MFKVFKYPIDVTDDQTIVLPPDAELLKIMVQHDVPCMWVRVDTSKAVVPWEFKLVGTGHPAPSYETHIYVDSFMIEDGALVFHLFSKIG